MGVIASTSVTERALRGSGIGGIIQAVVPTLADSDTLTVTLAARWIGQGFTVLSATVDKWTTAAAPASGARTRTKVQCTVVSVAEATGVVTLALATGGAVSAEETGRVYLLLGTGTLTWP